MALRPPNQATRDDCLGARQPIERLLRCTGKANRHLCCGAPQDNNAMRYLHWTRFLRRTGSHFAGKRYTLPRPEHSMKLGYFTMPVHPPARSYVETLKEDREAFILADQLGYTEGYCGEHLTDAAENIPNSLMFIATLLGATSQMKLGTAVVNLPHSHPVVVASNAAMLDNLFEGRFILGIGAGILRSDAEALGLLDADRNDMFAEAVDHILA